MNIKIVKNKYLNALFLLMLFSAIAHMIILLCLALSSGNFYLFNYFRIISADFFYPSVLNSFWGNTFSVVFVIMAYFIILKINKSE